METTQDYNFTAQTLRELLKEYACTNFTFQKKDGTIREANGTTNFDSIPEENHPKGTRAPTPGSIRYWDLDKSAWRSLKEDSICNINWSGSLVDYMKYRLEMDSNAEQEEHGEITV